MPWLAFGTTTHELREGAVEVGSGAEVDWRIATAELMRRHFVMTLDGDSVLVSPGSSDVVVVVNGAQVTTSHVLRDGDVVLAGSGRFVFSHDAPKAAAAGPSETAQGYLVDDQLKVAHPLTHHSTPIGRDASNAIVVRNPTASRFHAEVRREAGGFALHSMGARGAAINNVPLRTPKLLSEGDLVEIAFTTLRFTTAPPGRDLSVAIPHSTANDESGRKPTLGTGIEQVVMEDNLAGREMRRIQLLIALVLVAGGVWWWLGRATG